MRRFIIGITILALGAVTVAFLRRSRAGGAETYRFVTVTRGDLASAVSATGRLSAVDTVQVGTQVSGLVTELHADFNDHVKRGQLIAELDPTLLQQAVVQAQADSQRAVADLAQKQYLLDQVKQMYDNKVATETDYRTALYNEKTSEASLKSTLSSLERARQNLSYTKIYAPIDGVVIARNVNVGQTVAASLSAPTLFLLANDLSKMLILAQVDEGDIGQIHDGQLVTFTVLAYPNRTFNGTVRQVRMQSTTSDNVVNYMVVVSVNNNDGALRPGMTATVSFEISKVTDVLKVQNAALRIRPTEVMMAAAGMGQRGTDSARRGGRGRGGDSTARASGTRNGRSGGQAGELGGRSGGMQRTAGANGAQGRPQFAQLWYVDSAGKPAVMRVRTGLSDGQETEISGPANLKAGLQVIAAILSSSGAETSGPVASPFQTQQQGRGRGGFGRGGF
jgi:HlyD family secretion protein